MKSITVWAIAAVFTTLAVAAWATVPPRAPEPAPLAVLGDMNPLALMIATQPLAEPAHGELF